MSFKFSIVKFAYEKGRGCLIWDKISDVSETDILGSVRVPFNKDNYILKQSAAMYKKYLGEAKEKVYLIVNLEIDKQLEVLSKLADK